MTTSSLPPRPDFEAIEAAAHDTADRRTLISAMIGNLVFSWSNNESMLIYLTMILLETDEVSAAIVFATLNTTRARVDLIQRLAATKISNKAVASDLGQIIARFERCTRVRNEFNHCMYSLNDKGEIVQTRSMKIQEGRRGLRFGVARPMDDARMSEMVDTIRELRDLNRDVWDFLPRLQSHLSQKSDRPAPPPRKSGQD